MGGGHARASGRRSGRRAVMHTGAGVGLSRIGVWQGVAGAE